MPPNYIYIQREEGWIPELIENNVVDSKRLKLPIYRNACMFYDLKNLPECIGNQLIEFQKEERKNIYADIEEYIKFYGSKPSSSNNKIT